MNNFNILTIEEGCNLILKNIGPMSLLREELIEKCVLSLEFTSEDLKSEKLDSFLYRTKVCLGIALNRLIRAGKIKELNNGTLQCTKEEIGSVNLKMDVEEIILNLTSKNVYTKVELLSKVEEIYFDEHNRVEQTQDNINAVKDYAENFIETDFVQKTGDKYGAVPETLREKNERHLTTISPEEFEIHSIKLLELYYKKFVYKCECTGTHCGGMGDDGIDGYLTVTDNTLNSVEKIYIQVKYRKIENNLARKNTTRAVYEFGGVLAAKLEANIGIFVTNIHYSKSPKRFIESYKIKSLIYINGKTWLDLADKCEYSIAENVILN